MKVTDFEVVILGFTFFAISLFLKLPLSVCINTKISKIIKQVFPDLAGL